MRVFLAGRRSRARGDALERAGSADGADAYETAPLPIAHNGASVMVDVVRSSKASFPDTRAGQRQSTARTGAFSARDLRLDFFRGLALIFIFIDHIPENILSFFTVQSVQFFDAAEVFIFISGYTAAMVYGRALAAHGPLYAGAQILRRAWQLYVAHIFLFVIFIAEVSYTVTTFNNPMYNDEMRVGEFLTEPHIAIVQAMLLQFQPTFLDILPLYIVLLLAFPLVLIGLKRWPLPTVVASFVTYVFVQVDAISVPAYPPGRDWYFNPLAWQFLFITGAALGLDSSWVARLARRKRPLLAIAAAVVGLAFVVRLSWTIHAISGSFSGLFLADLWPVDKTDLSPIRLVSFFGAAAIVAATVPPWMAFLGSPAARPFVLCGRHSLEIFCLGILLSALGHFVLSEYDSGVLSQLTVNIVGILAICLTAKLIDWYREMGRAPPPQPATRPASGEG
jgi:hypothetical protein